MARLFLAFRVLARPSLARYSEVLDSVLGLLSTISPLKALYAVFIVGQRLEPLICLAFSLLPTPRLVLLCEKAQTPPVFIEGPYFFFLDSQAACSVPHFP